MVIQFIHLSSLFNPVLVRTSRCEVRERTSGSPLPSLPLILHFNSIFKEQRHRNECNLVKQVWQEVFLGIFLATDEHGCDTDGKASPQGAGKILLTTKNTNGLFTKGNEGNEGTKKFFNHEIWEIRERAVYKRKRTKGFAVQFLLAHKSMPPRSMAEASTAGSEARPKKFIELRTRSLFQK